ncbi:GTPase required for pre-60S ribosomal subunit nuclear export and maturation [Bulinus truncatus]|nr:GTPase required for pre-60S ribosomal subunit nuclear export and maturation [Bulinus truncatus]
MLSYLDRYLVAVTLVMDTDERTAYALSRLTHVNNMTESRGPAKSRSDQMSEVPIRAIFDQSIEGTITELLRGYSSIICVRHTMTPTLTLLLGLILCATEGAKPTNPFFMLKESRNQLPIVHLVENPNTIYDPRPSDINEKLLINQLKLDSNYRSEFVSIRDPGAKSPSLVAQHKSRPVGRRPRFLDLFRSALLKKIGKKKMRKVEQSLWKITSCPVVHSWKYLGIHFWPHWIKEGNCLRKRSCSLPEGMMCNPSSSTNIALLRWQCKNYKNHNTCQWTHILYPVLTECSCSCPPKT